MGETAVAAGQSARAMAGEPLSVRATTCCIVGGGPAGAVLGLLVARQGVEVTLLEAHRDFDREFRGDTLHPSVLELMDELGLADRLHELAHTKVRRVSFQTPDGALPFFDFDVLRSRYPYVMLVRQARFLEFITAEASRYPAFHLVMGANVKRLVERDGAVRGVRYRAHDGWHEVHATLTIACDGRHSTVRRLAGLEPVGHTPPIDVLWFHLPRRPGDPTQPFGRLGHGQFAGILDRGDRWQVAYIIPKGSYSQLRANGLPALRRAIAEVLPEFSAHLEELRDWRQLPLLSVEASRLRRWYRPGLLLIGDAAHVMTPAGGVGINYAIQDAVVAANVLTRPLLAWQRDSHPISTRRLRAVQRRRELPTRFIQAVQRVAQSGIEDGLLGRQVLSPAARRLLRLPGIRRIVARVIGIGLWRVHIRNLR